VDGIQKKIRINVTRFPISEVPTAKAELQQWCYDRYAEKDKLLDYYMQHHEFPTPKNPKWTKTPYFNTRIWFYFWILVGLYFTYITFNLGFYFFCYQLLGIGFFIYASTSKDGRRFWKLAPPKDYLDQLKKKKQN